MLISLLTSCWLCDNATFEGFVLSSMGLMMSSMLAKQDKDYKKTSTIKWNFTKFLVDRNGSIVARFEPTTSLTKVKERIREVL